MLNASVLALIEGYEPGSHGGYAWPSEPGTAGTTRDLVCDGEVIARAGAGNHCVGVTRVSGARSTTAPAASTPRSRIRTRSSAPGTSRSSAGRAPWPR